MISDEVPAGLRGTLSPAQLIGIPAIQHRDAHGGQAIEKLAISRLVLTLSCEDGNSDFESS